MGVGELRALAAANLTASGLSGIALYISSWFLAKIYNRHMKNKKKYEDSGHNRYDLIVDDATLLAGYIVFGFIAISFLITLAICLPQTIRFSILARFIN